MVLCYFYGILWDGSFVYHICLFFPIDEVPDSNQEICEQCPAGKACTGPA